MIRPGSTPGRLLAGLEFRDAKAAGPARRSERLAVQLPGQVTVT
jgi:hypothetical protein